jgi:hypothetical protein
MGSGGSGDDLDRRNYLAGKKSEGIPKKMATVREQHSTTEPHHATSKSHANSTQLNLRQNSSNIVSPRTAHDFTDIMGYKRMDMSNDVD